MTLLVLVPAVVLSVSYAAVCLESGRLWAWNSVVHEDGVRTFGQTVLYFEHALRELPLDLLLALALAGAARHFFPRPSEARRKMLFAPAVALTTATLAAIIGGTWIESGPRALALNLLQYHTRVGVAPDFGSHWHYHLLAHPALLLTAFCAAGLYAQLRFATLPGVDSCGIRWYLAALAAFAALSLAFRPRLEPFVDPRYLGHQARELFTGLLVTLPLGLAGCGWTARQLNAPGPNGLDRRPSGPGLAAGTLAACLGAYLATGVVLTKPLGQAQSASLTRLVAVHFFEHSLTYALLPAAACCFYLLLARQPFLALTSGGRGHGGS